MIQKYQNDEERREVIKKRIRAACKRWYREIKKDPEKYAHYLERHRIWQRERYKKRKAEKAERVTI